MLRLKIGILIYANLCFYVVHENNHILQLGIAVLVSSICTILLIYIHALPQHCYILYSIGAILLDWFTLFISIYVIDFMITNSRLTTAQWAKFVHWWNMTHTRDDLICIPFLYFVICQQKIFPIQCSMLNEEY